jgi:hypothetical protein
MFQDLDGTLKQLLNDPAGPAGLSAADVSFEAPDKNFTPSLATVDLFLYEVKENRDLRDPTPVVTKTGNGFLRKPPPVRIDCSYIVTTWSSAVGAARVAAEHRLLFQSLQWLTRFPTIPAVYLQGAMTNPTYPPPTMVAQLDPNKHAGEFWLSLGVSPRPAFYLTVTVEMVIDEVVASGSIVTTHSNVSGPDGSPPSDTLVQFGGRVSDAGTGLGLAGATVDVADLGLRATTDGDGRYSFLKVPAGAHTLRAAAVGYRTATQPLTVPGRQDEYDVTLNPL